MPKLNTTVKSVRIDNNVLEELEKKLNGRTFNSWLNEKINESVEGKPVKSPFSENLSEMIAYYKISEKEFLAQIEGLVQDGTITCEKGKLLLYDDYGLPTYLEICKERKIDPKTMIDKITDSLRIKG